MKQERQIESHRRKFDKKWKPILANCLTRTLENSAQRCRRAGLSDVMDREHPGLLPFAFCLEEQRAAVHALNRDLGYWAGSPGLAWMTKIVALGPKDPKYKEVVEKVLKEHGGFIAHRSGSLAEQDIRNAAKEKYSSKGMAAITRAYVETVVMQRTTVPLEIRQSTSIKTQKAVEAAVAEFDFCVKRNWKR